MPLPLASAARMAASLDGAILALPIGFPLLVPCARALAIEVQVDLGVLQLAQEAHEVLQAAAAPSQRTATRFGRLSRP
jgi:hypothetical protein